MHAISGFFCSGSSPTLGKRVTLIVAALLSLIFLAILPTQAQSQSRASFRESGNELYADCNQAMILVHGGSNFSPAKAQACTEYIEGVADAETLWTQDVCIPQPVENGQLVQIVWNYLDKHPEQRNKPAVNSVTVALLLTFGCRGK